MRRCCAVRGRLEAGADGIDDLPFAQKLGILPPHSPSELFSNIFDVAFAGLLAVSDIRGLAPSGARLARPVEFPTLRTFHRQFRRNLHRKSLSTFLFGTNFSIIPASVQ